MPKLRNAGPNGDSAADLLGDAIGMLEELEKLVPTIQPDTATTVAKGIREVIGVLRELEAV